VLRAFWVIVVMAVALGAMTVDARPAASTPTRVTLIGDSVATAIELEPDAQEILAKGIDLDLEVAPCRRIAGDSCPYQGENPPTLVELLPSLRLGSTVVVATGYNDYEDTFASTLESALAALRGVGVENVLWLTLRAERQSYVRMNELLRDAAKRHPEMTIVDWNLYSRSHPDWFQEDGLHLGRDGAIGLATLVHRRLDDLGLVASPTPRALTIATTRLPVAHRGRRYSARLLTSGGSAPIRWKRAQGTIPAGLALKPTGALVGAPRAAGTQSLLLRATDATGRVVARRFTITVAP
jgi:hypothetical protein